jgi:hypothetical protein
MATRISHTNKTDSYDITEILLDVLNTHTLSNPFHQILYVQCMQNITNTKYKPIICSKATPDKSPNKLWLRFRYTSPVCSCKIHNLCVQRNV